MIVFDRPKLLSVALLLAVPLAFAQIAASQTQAGPAAQAPAAPKPTIVHVPFPGAGSSPLAQQVAAITQEPAVARAHWGVAVTALDGTPVFGLNETQFFRPASNAKLYTTAAAMALLGPQATVETRVSGKLQALTGVISGDLVLKGAGDANFAGDDLPYISPANRVKDAVKAPPLHDLEDLADQLAAKGVKRVMGNIVGDDSLFPWEPYGQSWAADDLVWGYGAPVSALTVADNQLRLTTTPGKPIGAPGHEALAPPTVVLEQNGVSFYTVQAEVRTSAAGKPADGVQVERLPGSHTVRVYGAMAADATPDVEEIAIDDPAMYAAMALRGMLLRRGIEVSGSAVSHHRPPHDSRGFLTAVRAPAGQEQGPAEGDPDDAACPQPSYGPPLASHTSAPLVDDVVLTDKVSQNLHAELLLHRLGGRVICGAGSTVAGARSVRAFLLDAGLDADDFVLFDGSGLSSHDLVTPRATARLLTYATTQPWFAAWKNALPVGGEDGGLLTRFAKPPLKDHVFAKTGTLGESRALSGYLDCASGKTVIFAVMVDDHAPGTPGDREAMDRIVEAIAAAN